MHFYYFKKNGYLEWSQIYASDSQNLNSWKYEIMPILQLTVISSYMEMNTLDHPLKLSSANYTYWKTNGADIWVGSF